MENANVGAAGTSYRRTILKINYARSVKMQRQINFVILVITIWAIVSFSISSYASQNRYEIISDNEIGYQDFVTSVVELGNAKHWHTEVYELCKNQINLVIEQGADTITIKKTKECRDLIEEIIKFLSKKLK